METQKREITEAVGAQIKHLRHMRLFSQEELALRAAINPVYLGQVERGTKCPTVDTLYKIAKALEVPLTEVVRTEALRQSSEEHNHRVNALLSRVPEDQVDQVIDIIEKVVDLL